MLLMSAYTIHKLSVKYHIYKYGEPTGVAVFNENIAKQIVRRLEIDDELKYGKRKEEEEETEPDLWDTWAEYRGW